MFRIAKVAEMLDIHAATVYQLVSAGKLHCCRIGPRQGAIRITQEQIDEYLASVETRPLTVPAPVTHRLKASHLRRLGLD